MKTESYKFKSSAKRIKEMRKDNKKVYDAEDVYKKSTKRDLFLACQGMGQQLYAGSGGDWESKINKRIWEEPKSMKRAGWK